MAEVSRPNPDQLLAAIAGESQPERAAVGRLKVFFGAAPGVGKTYAMLEEARKAASEGVDVLVGYAEPHIRQETEAILIGLELLKYKLVEYRGTVLKEFDLDAALARKPKLICVDELAHTNPPGLRHAKRWQDVFELLDAGIDVYTTLNVQHLESVNDIVQRITGVEVRETLPDEVLDRADEIELIDTTPEELTERLREGKVYRPDIAERAIRQFFNKGNLTALRELALRRTAERVDQQMREQRQRAQVRHTWAASERVLVCVGPSPLSARLVRSARRLATGLRAPWVAATVETPATAAAPQAARDRTAAHLRLAQQLGAEVVTLSGPEVAGALVEYARSRNVTKMVIGKPELPRWRERLFGSFVEDIIRLSGDIDVYVIRGESTGTTPRPAPVVRAKPDWYGLAAAVLVTAAASGIGWLMHRELGLDNTNVLMVYLLGVLAVAWRFGRSASAAAACLGVLCFDVIFVPPYFSIAVSDREYLITFSVMLLTALLISTLVHRTRSQAALFLRRQTATQALLDFASGLADLTGAEAIAQEAAKRIGQAFVCDVSVLLYQAGNLRLVGQHGGSFADTDKELAVARWVADHGEVAGNGTATLPLAAAAYVPLHGSGPRVIGAVGVRPTGRNPVSDPDDSRLLESLTAQVAVAIDRALLAAEAREAWLRVEQEDLRNTLLAAVSHDLRTPLTAITGSASALTELSAQLSDQDRQDLAANILGEARRMDRVIANLLDASRLQSGVPALRPERIDLSALARAAVRRLADRLRDRPVTVSASDVPPIKGDPTAVDQVVTNLLENAVDHTPPGSPIELTVRADETGVTLEVADRGPGLPAGTESAVFEKFVRLSPQTDRRGLGLGLAISKAIILAHGGSIEAANRQGGGAVFRFRLPRDEMAAT